MEREILPTKGGIIVESGKFGKRFFNENIYKNLGESPQIQRWKYRVSIMSSNRDFIVLKRGDRFFVICKDFDIHIVTG